MDISRLQEPDTPLEKDEDEQFSDMPGSSLNILLPGNEIEEKAKPEATFSKYRLDTSFNLESLTKELVNSFNDRTFKKLDAFGQRHILSTFRARFDNVVPFSWPDYLAVVRRRSADCPNWSVSVIHATADVNESNGSAAVSVLSEVVCWRTRLRRLVMSVYKWKKRHGQWMCYEVSNVRGVDLSACPDRHAVPPIDVEKEERDEDGLALKKLQPCNC